MTQRIRQQLGHAGLLTLLLACCLTGWAVHPAAAAGTYTVTSTLDDGSSGTLRNAIARANADPGATIIFAPSVAGVIALQGNELDITASMTIAGPGSADVQVDGGGVLRLFNVTSANAQVSISGLTLQNGSAFSDLNTVTAGAGGTIYNGGSLTLTDCALRGSVASYGGAIYNAGMLSLAGCTLTGNSVKDTGAGGGLYNTGALMLTGCTLSTNSASYAGGLYNSGTLMLTDSSLSANLAAGDSTGNSGSGGGLYNDGTATLAGCALSVNVALGGSADNGGVGGAGGGVYSDSALVLVGCTLSANSAQANADGSGGMGGGLDNLGAATLTDDIFYADIAPSSAEIANDALDGPGAAFTAFYCDVQGSAADPSDFGPTNLDADPLFVRPANLAAQTPDPGDLHLPTISPCFERGIADPANATDHDGNVRPDPPSIGAYEYAFARPAADSQSVTTPLDTPVAVTLTGSNPVALPLTYTLTSSPVNGTLSGTAPDLIYTPNAGYAGPDSFTFTVSNGLLDSPTATVSLNVTRAIALTSLTTPSPVSGGLVVTATVTLNGPAPTDIVVGLSSSDSSVVRVHRSVVVPAGSQSGTFLINTYRSHTTKSVTLRAVLGQVALTAPLTITGR